MIGDDVQVTVVKIMRYGVKLGFSAPGKPIHRMEVYRAIKAEELEAGKVEA